VLNNIVINYKLKLLIFTLLFPFLVSYKNNFKNEVLYDPIKKESLKQALIKNN